MLSKISIGVLEIIIFGYQIFLSNVYLPPQAENAVLDLTRLLNSFPDAPLAILT